MEITLQLPDEIVRRWSETGDVSRRVLEAVLVDECARGRISRGKVADLLGLSFHESEDLFRVRSIAYPIKARADDAPLNTPLPKVR